MRMNEMKKERRTYARKIGRKAYVRKKERKAYGRKKERKKGVERRDNKRTRDKRKRERERGEKQHTSSFSANLSSPFSFPFPFPPPIFVNVLCVWQCGDERSFLFSLFCFFPNLIFPFSPFLLFPLFLPSCGVCCVCVRMVVQSSLYSTQKMVNYREDQTPNPQTDHQTRPN